MLRGGCACCGASAGTVAAAAAAASSLAMVGKGIRGSERAPSYHKGLVTNSDSSDMVLEPQLIQKPP